MNIKERINNVGAALRGRPADQPTNAASSLPKSDLYIINKIVDEFKDRSRKQIKSWRDAMTQAEDVENPRWYMQQDLYDDTIDAHLASVIDTRKMTTTNHRFYVIDTKNGEQLEEQTQLLDKKWFFDLMDMVIDAIFKKYTLIEVLRGPEEPIISLIPRRNVCPQFKRIYTEISGDAYIDYSAESSVIEINHHSSHGILNDVMPNCIWKKNSLQAWAEFGEKFGMPLISATTANQKDVGRIETMLKKMGEAAQAVLPTGTTITVHDLANAGNPKAVYESQATFHDNQISKRILGGTMVSDNGASRSQSEVHERTLDDKISVADQRLFRFFVNDQLFPVLQALGFPFDNTKHKFQFDESEELSLSEYWKMVNDATDKFYFDEKGVEWIAKTFNIPVVGIKVSTPAPSISKPADAKASFNNATAMWAMAVACNINLPNYNDDHHVETRHALSLPRAATTSKSLLNELAGYDQQIASFLYNDKITEADRQRLLKAKRVAEDLREGLFPGWGKRRLKTSWNAPDHRALAAMELNLFHFAEAKGRAEVVLLNGLLIDKVKHEIRSEADFIVQAKKINSAFNETFLSTERDFAIATGQTSARWHEFFGEKDNVSTWEYQTAGDDHVRDEHQIIDGRVFYFNDVEARRLWPPNGYKCRCEGIQHQGKPGDKLMTGNDAVSFVFANQKQREMFGFNRAETGTVFRQNQMYMGTLKDTDGKTSVGKPINDYTFADYGLKLRKETTGLKPLKLDRTITPDNVKELFTNNAGTKDYKAMGFTDYLRRKLILKEETFAMHNKGKYVNPTENRHQLFAQLSNILNDPSEVYERYYVRNKKEQMRFIKMFENETVVIDSEVTDKGFEITTWYYLKDTEEKVRSGIMIK